MDPSLPPHSFLTLASIFSFYVFFLFRTLNICSLLFPLTSTYWLKFWAHYQSQGTKMCSGDVKTRITPENLRRNHIFLLVKQNESLWNPTQFYTLFCGERTCLTAKPLTECGEKVLLGGILGKYKDLSSTLLQIQYKWWWTSRGSVRNRITSSQRGGE